MGPSRKSCTLLLLLGAAILSHLPAEACRFASLVNGLAAPGDTHILLLARQAERHKTDSEQCNIRLSVLFCRVFPREAAAQICGSQ